MERLDRETQSFSPPGVSRGAVLEPDRSGAPAISWADWF